MQGTRESKSPVELVAGVLRLTEEFASPKIEIAERNNQISYMGQQLFNPPSVEGWHQGLEWIETGSLTERVNFASQQLGDCRNASVRRIIGNVIQDEREYLTAESYVDKCLDELGAREASSHIWNSLVPFANDNGLPDIIPTRSDYAAIRTGRRWMAWSIQFQHVRARTDGGLIQAHRQSGPLRYEALTGHGTWASTPLGVLTNSMQLRPQPHSRQIAHIERV